VPRSNSEKYAMLGTHPITGGRGLAMVSSPSALVEHSHCREILPQLFADVERAANDS
jgi:hypothetical protein